MRSSIWSIVSAMMLVVGASHAAIIETLPPNNGSGGVFLSLTPSGPGFAVTQFAAPFGSIAGSPVSVEIYTRAGAYAGFTGSADGWTLHGTFPGTSAGTTTYAPIDIAATPLNVPSGGTTSIYLHSVTAGGGIRYQGTGTTATTTFPNADLTLFSDVARTGAVAFAGTQFTPRAFSGTVTYFIPEPASLGALCGGAVMLLIRRRSAK